MMFFLILKNVNSHLLLNLSVICPILIAELYKGRIAMYCSGKISFQIANRRMLLCKITLNAIMLTYIVNKTQKEKIKLENRSVSYKIKFIRMLSAFIMSDSIQFELY